MQWKRQQYYTNIDEEGLRTLWALGYSDGKIAKVMGASQTGITRARQRLNLQSNFLSPPHSMSEKDPKEIYEESISRSKEWKSDNNKKAKQWFASWQKANREHRTQYEYHRVKRLKGGNVEEQKFDG